MSDTKSYSGKIEDHFIPNAGTAIQFVFIPKGWTDSGEMIVLQNGQRLILRNHEGQEIFNDEIHWVKRRVWDRPPRGYEGKNAYKQKGIPYAKWVKWFASRPRIQGELEVTLDDDGNPEEIAISADEQKKPRLGLKCMVYGFLVALSSASIVILTDQNTDPIFIFVSMMVLVPSLILFWNAFFDWSVNAVQFFKLNRKRKKMTQLLQNDRIISSPRTRSKSTAVSEAAPSSDPEKKDSPKSDTETSQQSAGSKE